MLIQIIRVTAMSLMGLKDRAAAASVVIVGIMCVAGVLISVLTMAQSLTGAVLAVGRPDRAIVLRAGANAEGASTLTLDAAAAIASAPGVARTPEGEPLATADLLVPVNFARRSNGTVAALAVRGVSLLAVRPEIELVAGRPFTPGLREAIVGRNAQTVFAGLAIGDRFALRDSEWTVVGVYASGDAAESGMLTDAATLSSAYQRALLSSVTVRLESAAEFPRFEAALATNPALAVDVYSEPEYFAAQSESLAGLFFFVTYVVGGIMAAGALFGALNTMYSAVSARAVEIATLRALGFGAAGVVASVLAEALLLALAGAVAGAAIAWAIFSGDTISLGGSSASLVTQLRVTPAALTAGVVCAVVVGLAGGLLPALRAARLPVAAALRAV